MPDKAPLPSCLAFELGNEWCSVEPGADALGKLVAFITRALTADNLLVLTGLGSSMCVEDRDGRILAPTMDDLWAAASTHANFDKVLATVQYGAAAEEKNLENLLSRCHLVQAVTPSALLTDFVSDAEAMIVAKCGFVGSEVPLPAHEAFLRAIARRQPRKPRAKIFTVNYDLCFEIAASRTRFVVVDGFSHTPPHHFDGDYYSYDIVRRDGDRESPDYISNVFHLYKLHGSIDWRHEGTDVVRNSGEGVPLLIFPRSTKFESSYKPPFIEMFSRFQFALRQRNTALVIIGFGFRDPHIVEPLMSAIRANASLQVLLVDISIPDDSDSPAGRLVTLARSGDRRLWFLKSTFADFVPLMPDLVGAGETESHLQRIRAALEGR